ncbi:MAG: 50S ribosomal protein L17 [Patescibacteria group bacterium]
MLKKIFGKKLSRESSTRKALFRSMVRSLVEHGSIKTTQAKAKAVQIEIDRLMKLVKVNTVASKRSAIARLGNDRKTLDALFAKYSVAANQRKGGFTRVINLGPRKGDAAPVVKLEMVDEATKVAPVVKIKKTVKAKPVVANKKANKSK